MDTISFIVDNNVTNNLQRLQVETESRQSLIAFMINQDMMGNKNFNKYQDEYKDFYLKYSQAKTDFQKKYVDPILVEKHIDPNKAFWSLNFASSECTISVQI